MRYLPFAAGLALALSFQDVSPKERLDVVIDHINYTETLFGPRAELLCSDSASVILSLKNEDAIDAITYLAPGDTLSVLVEKYSPHNEYVIRMVDVDSLNHKPRP